MTNRLELYGKACFSARLVFDKKGLDMYLLSHGNPVNLSKNVLIFRYSIYRELGGGGCQRGGGYPNEKDRSQCRDLRAP